MVEQIVDSDCTDHYPYKNKYAKSNKYFNTKKTILVENGFFCTLTIEELMSKLYRGRLSGRFIRYLDAVIACKKD